MKRRLLSTARLAFPLAAAFAAMLAPQLAKAQSISWTGATNGAWLTTTNWTGGTPAGSTLATNTNIAVFNVAPNATIGIDMNATSGVYYLGAIDYTNATARNFENSNTTVPGVLTLNGATVNAVANTILRHSTTTLMTIRNGTGLGTMGLALGNATNNIIQINHSGGITISGNLTGSSRNLTLSSISHGSGVLTLSGTNSYTGNTRIDSGVVQFASQAALYNNGSAAAWSKDNLVVGGLGTANFGMGGAGQFTVSDINNLLGLSDSASNGFRSGATIGLDTTGGSVSFPNAVANPNAGNNVLNFTKLGTNTLTLEQNNTYTGRTFISAGTLQLGTGGTTGSLATGSAIRNNGTLTINRSNAVVQGVDFSGAPMAGTGALVQAGTGTTTLNAANTYTGSTTVSAGTLQLDNALAIQNSALIVTGSGTVTLGPGVVIPALGGLGGSTDLAAIFPGLGTVTNLTLNPQGAQSTTYGGVIANGAMSLTKNGSGTQILTGANTYTGTTTINAGTLNLSGAAGSIAASTGLTLNNGTLTLANTTALEGGIDRISNTAPITSNGGVVNYTNTSVIGVNYAESVGAVNLGRGQLTFNLTTTQLGSQILTIAGLTRAGTGNTSTVSLTGGPNPTTSQFVVTSAVGTATPAGQIIGPWFNTNGTGAGSADYAVYNAAGQVVGTGTAPSTESSWTDAANAYTVRTAAGGASGAAAAARLTATRNMVGLRIDTFSSGAAATLAGTFFTRTGNTLADGDPLTFAAVPTGLTANIPYYVVNVGVNGPETFQVSTTPGGSAATFTAVGTPTIVPGILLGAGANLGTTGILHQSGVTSVIAPGTGGVVTLPGTTSDNLYINTGGSILATGNLTVLAPITNNGAGVLTLVKSGLGNLTLSGTNTFTGGTVLNAGTVTINNPDSLGTGNVTIDGSSRINATGNALYANNITINSGTTLTLQNPATGSSSTAEFTGVLAGSGNLFLPNSGANAIQGILSFTNPANTFTGNVVLSASGSGDEHFRFNSLGDAGNFTIAKNGNRQLITYTGDTNLTFNTRQIVVADTMFGTTDRQGMDGGGSNPVNVLANDGTGTLTFTRDMVVNNFPANYGVLYLSGSNAGDNTFSGRISDTAGASKFSIGKFGSGKWILSGMNTFEGNTLIAAGTLELATIANSQIPQPLGIGTAIQLGVGGSNANGTLRYTGGTASTNKQVQIGAVANAPGSTGAGSILNDGTGALTFSNPAFNPTTTGVTGARTLTLGGNFTEASTIAGVIQNNAAAGIVNLTKTGDGTWVLSGSNTYTGSTNVSSGTLLINGGQSAATGAVAVNGFATLGGSGTLGGSITVTGGASLAPGATAGTAGTLATLGGLDLTAPLAGGSGKLLFDLGSIAASDRIVVGGTLNLGTDSLDYTDFVFSPLAGLANGTYKLITSGTLSGTLDPVLPLSGPIGAGTGTLQITGNDLELVVTGLAGLTGYNLWASTNAPGTNPAQDQDGDGVSNAVEYVLGGTITTNDQSKLPLLSTSAGNMLFTFNRAQASIDGSTVVTIEVGTTLATWPAPSPYAVPAGAASSNPGVSVIKNTPAAGFDTITLTLPTAPDPTKFARLKVVVTP